MTLAVAICPVNDSSAGRRQNARGLVFAGMGASRLYLQHLDLSEREQPRLVAERIMPCWRALAWPSQRVGRSPWARSGRWTVDIR
jgi:hypothetical protein